MAMEVLHQRPTTVSFVPLAEHQSRTPASFYDGPPILHHHSESCKIVINERELLGCPALVGLRGKSEAANGTAGAGASENAGDEGEKEVVIEGVNVWVTSEKLILFSSTTNTGLSIPYPSISLHAIQRLPLPGSSQSEQVQGLYMQLATQAQEAADTADEDEDEECASLTIIPQLQAQAQSQSQAQAQTESTTTTTEEQTPTESLFAALSACSNLHPDLAANEEEENDNAGAQQQQALDSSVLFQNGLIFPGNNAGGLPPAMPGSGGWITADNVDDYFDEEGNWKGVDAEGRGEMEAERNTDGDEQDPLGPGAGSVRTRDQGEGAGEEDETKWRRTE